MQPKPHVIASTHRVVQISQRKQQRSNVLEWRGEAFQKRQQQPVIMPAAPGEDGSKEIVSPGVQWLILLWAVMGTALVWLLKWA